MFYIDFCQNALMLSSLFVVSLTKSHMCVCSGLPCDFSVLAHAGPKNFKQDRKMYLIVCKDQSFNVALLTLR